APGSFSLQRCRTARLPAPAPATPAAATTTAAIATAAAAAGAGLILRFVDTQRASAQIVSIQVLNGTRRIGLVHLHEAEAARPTGFTIRRQRHLFDGAVLAEQRRQIRLTGREGEVTHINLRHDSILSK